MDELARQFRAVELAQDQLEAMEGHRGSVIARAAQGGDPARIETAISVADSFCSIAKDRLNAETRELLKVWRSRHALPPSPRMSLVSP